MLSLTFFTFLFIIIVAMASAEPWRISTKHRKTRDLTKMGGNYDCLYTYTAFQPNMDFFKEKVAEITVDKCKDETEGNKTRRRSRGKGGKKEAKIKGNSRKRKNVNKKKKRHRETKQERRSRKNDGKRLLGKKNRQKTKSRRIPRTRKVKRNKKVYRDLKQFQDWKRMMSQRRLMTEPVAQEAVASLWSGLMMKGDDWREVFDSMHQQDDHSS